MSHFSCILVTMKKMMPREKLAKYGASNLTDLELLQLLIGSGNKQASAQDVAKQILKVLKDKGSSISYEDLMSIRGMGVAKTSEIIALFELGRRYLMPADRPVISSTESAIEQLIYSGQKAGTFCCPYAGWSKSPNQQHYRFSGDAKSKPSPSARSLCQGDRRQGCVHHCRSQPS